MDIHLAGSRPTRLSRAVSDVGRQWVAVREPGGLTGVFSASEPIPSAAGSHLDLAPIMDRSAPA